MTLVMYHLEDTSRILHYSYTEPYMDTFSARYQLEFGTIIESDGRWESTPSIMMRMLMIIPHI